MGLVLAPKKALPHTAKPAATPRAAVNLVARNDNLPADARLDQYYTDPVVAAQLYAFFQRHFDVSTLRPIEPSAGAGAFFRLMPPGSLAFDVDPRYPGVRTVDFLSARIPRSARTAFLGNPPFGRNASMAVRFFNHAAPQAAVIAFIMPRSVRKASIENRLDRDFHLVAEVDVPADAFLFRGMPYDVPAVFQIWERRAERRALRKVETTHPDFEFTTPDDADFAIQRVGARAGRIHHDFGMSPSSHHFIKGDVEAIMAELDFGRVARDVAGNPSLSKSEIVALYRERAERGAGDDEAAPYVSAATSQRTIPQAPAAVDAATSVPTIASSTRSRSRLHGAASTAGQTRIVCAPTPRAGRSSSARRSAAVASWRKSFPLIRSFVPSSAVSNKRGTASPGRRRRHRFRPRQSACR